MCCMFARDKDGNDDDDECIDLLHFLFDVLGCSQLILVWDTATTITKWYLENALPISNEPLTKGFGTAGYQLISHNIGPRTRCLGDEFEALVEPPPLLWWNGWFRKWRHIGRLSSVMYDISNNGKKMLLSLLLQTSHLAHICSLDGVITSDESISVSKHASITNNNSTN